MLISTWSCTKNTHKLCVISAQTSAPTTKPSFKSIKRCTRYAAIFWCKTIGYYTSCKIPSKLHSFGIFVHWDQVYSTRFDCSASWPRTPSSMHWSSSMQTVMSMLSQSQWVCRKSSLINSLTSSFPSRLRPFQHRCAYYEKHYTPISFKQD